MAKDKKSKPFCNYAAIDPELNEKKHECLAIIETPKGSRNKFKYDDKSHILKLSGLLPEGMMFPFDFGFIPSTVGGDGDPYDIMVLMDAPAVTGCLIPVRIIGVIEAEQTEDGDAEENSRLLGVAVHSYSHRDMKNIDEVDKELLKQVEEFFIFYNKQRGKKFEVTALAGPRQAVKCLKKSMDAFRKHQES